MREDYARFSINAMLKWREEGATSGEIADRMVSFTRTGCNPRDVHFGEKWTRAYVIKMLIKRGIIPAEAWFDAELEDFTREEIIRLRTVREKFDAIYELERLRHQRTAVRRMAKRLDAALDRARRADRAALRRAAAEARQARREAKPRDVATTLADIERAANATAAASANAETLRKAALARVHAMAPRMTRLQVAAELTRQGVKRVHGGAWTKGAVGALLRSRDN